MRCIIGIDAGTTHLKCALIGADGRIRTVKKAPTPVCSDGEASWYDPQQIYDTVKSLVMGLEVGHREETPAGDPAEKGPGSQEETTAGGPAENGPGSRKGTPAGSPAHFGQGPDGLEICGICITGMSEAGLVLDRESGRELTEILPWFDRRTEALAAQIGQDEARLRFMKTGLYNSFKYGIYKYLWLLEKKGLAPETTIWLSMCDYLAYRLTGNYATTAGFAVRTYAYDMENGCWDSDFLSRYGLTVRQFPQVVREGESIGCCVDRELTEHFGKNVKVVIGGHDHICALYAMAGENGLRLADSCGTAETYMGITEKRSLSEADYAEGIVYGPYPGGRKWFWMGNLPSSGQSVEWFRGRLGAEAISYEEMELLLEQLAGRPTGALYFPFMNGVGTPVYRGDVKPWLEGLRESCGTGEVMKAVIEGVQYQGRWILECAPVDPENRDMQLWCAGGAAASRQWMQIKADVLGMPVHVPEQEEATLLGAAAVFLLENGTEQEQETFFKSMEQERAVYQPDDENRERYRVLAEKYRSLAREKCGHGD